MRVCDRFLFQVPNKLIELIFVVFFIFIKRKIVVIDSGETISTYIYIGTWIKLSFMFL